MLAEGIVKILKVFRKASTPLLSLTLLVGAAGLFAVKPSEAQECYSGACDRDVVYRGGRPYDLQGRPLDQYGRPVTKSTVDKQIDQQVSLDIQNYRLAGEIYTATTKAIGQVLESGGVDAAKALIQHPERSVIVANFIRQHLHEGNLAVAARAMGYALSDAENFIDAGRLGSLPSVISEQDRTAALAGAGQDRVANPKYKSELALLSYLSGKSDVNSANASRAIVLTKTTRTPQPPQALASQVGRGTRP